MKEKKHVNRGLMIDSRTETNKQKGDLLMRCENERG